MTDQAEMTLSRIREILRDPDLYDSHNSIITRCLVRDIKEAMELPLTGRDVPHPASMTGEDLAYARAADEILREVADARTKFRPFNSPHEGYAVIAEELDELWDDVKADRTAHAIDEAIQVGAMALRFIVDMRAELAAIGDVP